LQAAIELSRKFPSPGDVVIVEANDRVGGRIKEAEGIVPWAVNTGPEFIHGAENSPLVDLIRRAGWRTKEYEWPDKYYYTKDNRMLPADTEDPDVLRVHELFANVRQVHLEPGEDMSALEWLQRSGENANVVALAESIYANDFGTSLHRLGLRELQIEQAAWKHGEEYLVLDRPLGAVPKLMAEGLQVHLSWPVGEITYHPDKKCMVLGARGGCIRCDAVVLAVPLSTLQSKSITLFPPLPPYQQHAVHAMAMGNAVKISLGFSSAFWPSDLFDVVCPGCFLPEIWMIRPDGIPKSSKAGLANHLVTGFIAGDQADQLTRMSEARIIDLAVSQLDSMFGTVSQPKPASTAFVKAAVHNWANEPYIHAAYSYPKVGAHGARAALAVPIGLRVFLAGEHTDPGCNPCLQSAMATGSRAAAQLINALEPLQSKI